MVSEMEPIEIPEFPRLRGEEAIEALYDFVEELEEQRRKELTEKQVGALTEFAWGLIFSIEAEMRSNAMAKGLCEQLLMEMRSPKDWKKTVKHIPASFNFMRLRK